MCQIHFTEFLFLLNVETIYITIFFQVDENPYKFMRPCANPALYQMDVPAVRYI
jgi:hypothetical protein